MYQRPDTVSVLLIYFYDWISWYWYLVSSHLRSFRCISFHFDEFRYVSFYVIEKGFCYRWRAIQGIHISIILAIVVVYYRPYMEGITKLLVMTKTYPSWAICGYLEETLTWARVFLAPLFFLFFKFKLLLHLFFLQCLSACVFWLAANNSFYLCDFGEICGL